RLDLAVVADPGMAAVLAGHQTIARRRAHGGAGVVLGEAYSLAGHPVDTGGADLLLPVTAELGVAQIIGENKYDVRLFRRRCGAGAGGAERETGEDDAD